MGKLITFEGGEGAGKSTLITKMGEALRAQGRLVVQTREPGGTPLGQALRELLLHHQEFALTTRAELLLFLTDRAQHVKEVLTPALQRGSIVLCDRFSDSTLAYQSGGRDLPEADVRTLCQFAAEGLNPDLTLYLDLDPQAGLQRVHKLGRGTDKFEAQDLVFHQKVRQVFLRIAQQEPQRVRIIDASQSPNAVYNQALEHVRSIL